jgi:hypothetical protein
MLVVDHCRRLFAASARDQRILHPHVADQRTDALTATVTSMSMVWKTSPTIACEDRAHPWR